MPHQHRPGISVPEKKRFSDPQGQGLGLVAQVGFAMEPRMCRPQCQWVDYQIEDMKGVVGALGLEPRTR